MSTDHEQQTKLTDIDKTKLTYPNGTQLANNNSTEIDYTIRLVLANPDDSEKENDRTHIRQFDIAGPLEHTAEEDTSITHRGHDNNQGSTDSTHQGCQILPTDVNSTSSRTTSPSHRTSQDDGEIRGRKGNCRPFSEIPITTETRSYQSFDHLRTTSEISERITQYTHSTGTIITTDDNE